MLGDRERSIEFNPSDARIQDKAQGKVRSSPARSRGPMQFERKLELPRFKGAVDLSETLARDVPIRRVENLSGSAYGVDRCELRSANN